MTDVPEVSPQQRRAVLDAADINLKTVIDQITSVADNINDDSLEQLVRLLNDADQELDRQRGA